MFYYTIDYILRFTFMPMNKVNTNHVPGLILAQYSLMDYSSTVQWSGDNSKGEEDVVGVEIGKCDGVGEEQIGQWMWCNSWMIKGQENMYLDSDVIR